MKDSENPEEFSKLSRKERREKALDTLFGKDRKSYMGNIWGWRFSIISFVGLLLVAGLTVFGVMTGRIDLSEQELEPRPSEHIKNESQHFNKGVPTKDTTKDTQN